MIVNVAIAREFPRPRDYRDCSPPDDTTPTHRLAIARAIGGIKQRERPAHRLSSTLHGVRKACRRVRQVAAKSGPSARCRRLQRGPETLIRQQIIFATLAGRTRWQTETTRSRSSRTSEKRFARQIV